MFLGVPQGSSRFRNLLVVLCGDKSTQPIVNAGTIYQ